MQLFVYYTPESIPPDTLPDCAVAIDVLRATTTMATALAAGAEAVQVFSDLDRLWQVSEAWPAERRLRAGERGGSQVPGWELGNSPLACTPETMAGRRLFISTTNGTRCLEQVQAANIVLAGSLINRQSVVEQLLVYQSATVWLVCSGWEGAFSLEDTTCAGAILQGVVEALGQPEDSLMGNDEAVAAGVLYSHWRHDLLGMLHHASHGQRLLRLGCAADLEYCAGIDTVAAVPQQQAPGVLVLEG